MFIPSIGGQALCGGSLISTQTTLTAAHCVEGASSGTIVVGAHFLTNPNEPLQRRLAVTPGHIRMHPGWDPSLIRNDIALVRLPEAVAINAAVRPAILPTAAQINMNFAGELGVVSGWGVFSDAQGASSDVLRFVYDNIITNGACSLRFPGKNINKLRHSCHVLLFSGVIQPSNICVTGTNGRGACSGDSGGPLTGKF